MKLNFSDNKKTKLFPFLGIKVNKYVNLYDKMSTIQHEEIEDNCLKEQDSSLVVDIYNREVYLMGAIISLYTDLKVTIDNDIYDYFKVNNGIRWLNKKTNKDVEHFISLFNEHLDNKVRSYNSFTNSLVSNINEAQKKIFNDFDSMKDKYESIPKKDREKITEMSDIIRNLKRGKVRGNSTKKR